MGDKANERKSLPFSVRHDISEQSQRFVPIEPAIAEMRIRPTLSELSRANGLIVGRIHRDYSFLLQAQMPFKPGSRSSSLRSQCQRLQPEESGLVFAAGWENF